MALRVDLDEPWLVDVGFGQFSDHPLRLLGRELQADPGGGFLIADVTDGDVDVAMDGVPQYRLEARPRQLADYRATCWWHQTSPHSHFTQNLVCSRRTEGGRVTLSGRTLIVTDAEGRHENILESDAAVLTAYREQFGISLKRVPGIAVGLSQSSSSSNTA